MGAYRYQATWRGITFNQLYDDSGVVDDPYFVHINEAYRASDYRLERLDLTRVEATDYRELRQWLEGAEANEAFEGVMVIMGSGIIYGNNHGDLEDRDAALREAFSIAACRRAFAANDPVGVGPFIFKRDTLAAPGNLPLQLFARPMTGRPITVGHMREGLTRRFQFNLACFDPRLYSQTVHSVGVPTSGSGNVANGGNLYSSPKIVIVSAGSGTIALTFNGSLTFAATTLTAGTWTIDVGRSTMTKSDGTNGLPFRTAGYISQCLLDPGNNVISTVGSANLTSVTFQYRDAYA